MYCNIILGPGVHRPWFKAERPLNFITTVYSSSPYFVHTPVLINMVAGLGLQAGPRPARLRSTAQGSLMRSGLRMAPSLDVPSMAHPRSTCGPQVDSKECGRKDWYLFESLLPDLRLGIYLKKVVWRSLGQPSSYSIKIDLWRPCCAPDEVLPCPHRRGPLQQDRPTTFGSRSGIVELDVGVTS